MSSDEQVYLQIQNISSAFEALKDNFEKKNQQIKTLLRQKENLTCTCQEQALWIDKLQHQIEQLQTNRTQIEEKLTQFQTQQQQQIDTLNDQLQSARNELLLVRTQLDNQHRQNDKISRQYTDSQSEISRLQKQLAAAEKENAALKTEVKTLADVRSRYESELESGQEKDRKIESLTDELTHIGVQVNDLTEQLNHHIEPSKDDPSDDLVKKLNQKLKNYKQIFGELQSSSENQQTSTDSFQTNRRNNLHQQLSILSGS